MMSIIMGLQHAMAMIGGLITPPLVVFKFTVCGFAQQFCPDLVQVSNCGSRHPATVVFFGTFSSIQQSSNLGNASNSLVRGHRQSYHLWYLHHHQHYQNGHPV